MTPEEYRKLEKEQFRYGERYDDRVDQYCPSLAYNKDGKVSKRQPRVQKRTKAYWQAQCSFRGLKTSGAVEELQDRLRNRVREQDVVCKQNLERLSQLLRVEDERLEKERKERWWQDSTRTLTEKANSDPLRALKEALAADDTLKRECVTIKTSSYDLSHVATQLGLSHQTVDTPRSMDPHGNRWTIVGKPESVRESAARLSLQAKQDFEAMRAKQKAAMEARQAQQQAQRAAFMTEASQMEDWDPTGCWKITCEELATYSSGSPADLTMDIYRDDYLLSDIHDDKSSDDEYGEEDEDDEEGYGYRQDTTGGCIQRASVEETNIPRFSAQFDFSVVEGVMRIFPDEASRRGKNTFKIKNKPELQYVWRGRDTGTGEIQTRADEKTFKMTLKENGTRVEGTFGCEYLRPVSFIGVKLTHGRGQKNSSASKWRSLSKRAWERECVSRWH